MSLDEELTDLLNEIAYENKRIMDQEKFHYLVSLCAQDITILTLLEKENNITAKKIISMLKVPKTTINSAVERLVNKGFIEKRVNEQDKREYLLSLSEKGYHAAKEHDSYEKRMVEFIKNQFIDEKELLNVLRKRKKYHVLQNSR